MERFLDKYIIYYANKWETNHRLTHALAGLSIYIFQLLYFIWAICVIPFVIYLFMTIAQERAIIVEKDTYAQLQLKYISGQNSRIASLEANQELTLDYKDAVHAYYDEVLKSRGLKSIKIESKKVGPNSFKLIFPPS